jgi:hypothetical protein
MNNKPWELSGATIKTLQPTNDGHSYYTEYGIEVARQAQKQLLKYLNEPCDSQTTTWHLGQNAKRYQCKLCMQELFNEFNIE